MALERLKEGIEHLIGSVVDPGKDARKSEFRGMYAQYDGMIEEALRAGNVQAVRFLVQSKQIQKRLEDLIERM